MRWLSEWVEADDRRQPLDGQMVEIELEPDPTPPGRGVHVLAYRHGDRWYDCGHRLVTRRVLRWLATIAGDY